MYIKNRKALLNLKKISKYIIMVSLAVFIYEAETTAKSLTLRDTIDSIAMLLGIASAVCLALCLTMTIKGFLTADKAKNDWRTYIPEFLSKQKTAYIIHCYRTRHGLNVFLNIICNLLIAVPYLLIRTNYVPDSLIYQILGCAVSTFSIIKFCEDWLRLGELKKPWKDYQKYYNHSIPDENSPDEPDEEYPFENLRKE